MALSFAVKVRLLKFVFIFLCTIMRELRTHRAYDGCEELPMLHLTLKLEKDEASFLKLNCENKMASQSGPGTAQKSPLYSMALIRRKM